MEQETAATTAGAVSFEDGVSDVMVKTEELRLRLAVHNKTDPQQEVAPEHILQDLEVLVQALDFLLRLTLDAPGDDVRQQLFSHCGQKVFETTITVLEYVTTSSSQDSNEVPDDASSQERQGAIARIAELALMVDGMLAMPHQQEKQQQRSDDTEQRVIEMYTSYQRQVLRQRAKPAIAQLAQWRTSRAAHSNSHHNVSVEEDDDMAQPHTHAMTVILGQGSSLVHPLIVWKQQVPPESAVAKLCQSAIAVLDEQAQTLTKTVLDWCLTDRKINDWMSQAASYHPQHEDGEAESSGASTKPNLAELDALVEEMSFACQILARYQLLVKQESPLTIVPKELLPEWTWRYAALERYLSTQQWQYALQMACPVDIVMGMAVKVPSVVEDAQYLSTRALERAASTRSIQAMGTVAHSISNDVWSTDIAGGVHQALLDQTGCWVVEDTTTNKDTSCNAMPPTPTSNTNSGNNTFASALLDALDEDLGPSPHKHTPPPKKKPPSAPSSGGLLVGAIASLTGGGSQQQLQQQQIRLGTQLCNLNGIHSAYVACNSLVKLLESLLEEYSSAENVSKETAMIQLAREELLRYAESYRQYLNHQVQEVLVEWCGSGSGEGTKNKGMLCLHALRDFFGNETYELDATSFHQAEADDRLDRDMMGLLRDCLILKQLDKCDAEVTTLLCRELSSMVANLVLHSLWEEEPTRRRFTDWGSLLLSKQVRLLQSYVCGLVETGSTEETYNTAPLLDRWERLSQVVTLLQLEKPSDWYAYQATCSLTAEELRQTLSLRVDFSADAIAAVCESNKKEDTAAENKPENA